MQKLSVWQEKGDIKDELEDAENTLTSVNIQIRGHSIGVALADKTSKNRHMPPPPM
jgi:hypothetical protein